MSITTGNTRIAFRLLAGSALALGMATVAASTAEAQIYVGPWGPRYFSIPYPAYDPYHRVPRERRLHPATVVDELEDRGFRDLVVVARRPDVYVIEGLSARREPVRLIVDAYDGEILERFSRGPARTAALPPAVPPTLPTPPVRRSTGEAPKASPAPKLAGPAPEAPKAPATVVRPRSADWAPINSVPVAPLE